MTPGWAQHLEGQPGRFCVCVQSLILHPNNDAFSENCMQVVILKSYCRCFLQVQLAGEEWAPLKWQVSIWVFINAGCIPWSQLFKSLLISKWVLKSSSTQLLLPSVSPPRKLWLQTGPRVEGLDIPCGITEPSMLFFILSKTESH